MKAPVLVTGSRGFFGKALLAELSRRGVRSARAAARPDADLEDSAQARRLVLSCRPAVIFHLAGTTSGDASRLWRAHVTATLNLLDAALELPRAPRVVIAGSSAVYGDAPGRSLAREDGALNPLGPYGASKLSQEIAALSYRERGLQVAVARVFNACGPGCPERIVPGAFIEQLARLPLAGGELRVGNLAPRRDFVDVRDIARALADLGESRAPGGVYNVCSGRAVAIGEVARRLIALSGRPAGLRADASRRRGRDLAYLAGSGRKLARAAGWTPRIGLEQSLEDALAWRLRS